MKKIIRKLATAILAGTLAFSMVPATVQAAGWKQNKNGYWWQENNYSYPRNQWKTIYGKQYHFNSGGYMDTDWTKVDGKWYYFGGKHDGVKKTYWQLVRGKYYWLGSNGVMRTGWQKVYNKYYWLGGSNDGAMKTGWVKLNGKYYWLGNNGDMKSGWQTIYKKKYYLGGANDGAMKTGWQQIGGYWYYFGGADDGSLKTNTWIGNYYVDANGRWTKTRTKTDNQILSEFISGGSYKKYTSGYSNLSYVITDLNADSVPELLIESADGLGFFRTWIFVLDSKKNVVKVNETYGYGQFRYSSTYDVIAGSPETRPMPSAWDWPFYKLNGTKLEYVFSANSADELKKYSLENFTWTSLGSSTKSYSEMDESQSVVQSANENELQNESPAAISEDTQESEQNLKQDENIETEQNIEEQQSEDVDTGEADKSETTENQGIESNMEETVQ